MSIPARGRDDVIFGAKDKKKEPPLSAELSAAVNEILADSSATSEDFKSVGNKCFAAGNFSAAIKLYTKALELDPNNEVLLSNRSASYVQSPLLAGPSLALKDANRVIALKPDWFKAHLRKGDALFAMKKFRLALDSYDAVLRLNPSCATAVESRKHCQRELLEAGEDVLPARSGGDVTAASSQGPTERRSNPETCPYDATTHRAERRQVSQQEREETERHLDTETLVKTWSQDTVIETGTTACKKRNVNLAEVDREAGKSYREQLMSSFRKKVDTNTEFQQDLQKRKEESMLLGDGLDYRRSADDAKKHLGKGTDGVGLAISAEAYKAEQYKSRVW